MVANRVVAALIFALAGCEPATGPQFERIARLEVASARVECPFVAGPPECLSVRWEATEDWEPLRNGIEGFVYESGFEYSLEVAVFAWRGPINPDQSWNHRLVRVLRKSRVRPA